MNYPRCPKHSSFSSSSSSPSTKSADISRLMDPSYASSSSSSSSSYTAYVDHDGEFHDPDYRHFPSAPVRIDASSRRQQRQRQRQRGRWASDDFEEEDSDEEDLYEEEAYYPRRRSSSLTRQSHRRQQRSGALSPLPLALPALSTSPSSINSVESWLSGGASDDYTFDAPHYSQPTEHSGVLRKKRGNKSSLFCSPSHSPSYLPSTYSSSVPSLPDYSEQEDDEKVTPEIHVRPASPLSGEALKKEWHAISLSVSIGVFRMKRRMKEAIARS